MKEFFFRPIDIKIISDFDSKQTIWNNFLLNNKPLSFTAKIIYRNFNEKTKIEINNYLVFIKKLHKILDLRNLYVKNILDNFVLLIQDNFSILFEFESENCLLHFSKIAKNFWIRKDMKQVYSFDLFNRKHRIGSGGFGDVRMVKHRETRNVYALKTVEKEKIDSEELYDNSMR